MLLLAFGGVNFWVWIMNWRWWNRFITPKAVETSVVAKIKNLPVPLGSRGGDLDADLRDTYDYGPAIEIKRAVYLEVMGQYWDWLSMLGWKRI